MLDAATVQAGRGVLWARAAITGSVACFLGVAGHVVGGGLLPGPGWLALALAWSVLMVVPVLVRPASAGRLAALMATTQTGVHLLLSATAGHAPGAGHGTGHGTGHGAHRHSSAHADPGTLAVPPADPLGDLAAHAPMMAAHLAVVAVVALWLAHGERCLWTVLALTGRRVLAVAFLSLPPPPAAPAVGAALDTDLGAVVLRRLWSTRDHGRRGPPLLVR